jgi:hypothetical protein
VLVCSERRVLLAGCWWLVCFERKVLLASRANRLYAITDHVAPTFRCILEENFLSLSGGTLTINDGQANYLRWWAQRMKLNNYLDKLLK